MNERLTLPKMIDMENNAQNPENPQHDAKLPVVGSVLGVCSHCESEQDVYCQTESCCWECQQDDAPCNRNNCGFREQEVSRCSNCDGLM